MKLNVKHALVPLATGSFLLPAIASAQTTMPDAAATQTTLLGYVFGYGGMAAGVIAAGTGFAILFGMTRKAKA